MKNFFSKLSLNKRLAGIALLLGVIAVFAGNPYKGNKVTLDTKELGIIVQKGTDTVNADELADWIIQGKSDYRLLDLRSEKEFNDYHIQTAENAPISQLDGYDITRNEKIVLYSSDGIRSSQGWMLLKAKGFKGVYMLSGGIQGWKEKILFPVCSDSGTAEEKASFEKKKEISKFFGGTPQLNSTEDVKKESPKIDMPKLESPGGNTQPAPTGTKKKEGC